MKAGEEVKMRCFIFYKLRDGKISEIRLSQFTGQ